MASETCRIGGISIYSAGQLKDIRAAGIKENIANARRLAASYLCLETRGPAKRAIAALKDHGQKPFVPTVIKEMYNVMRKCAQPCMPFLPQRQIEQRGIFPPDDLVEYSREGVLMETHVIYEDPDGSGHTGKTLGALPWQLVCEHRHTDMIALEKGTPVPPGYLSSPSTPDFAGALEYDSLGRPTGRVSHSIKDWTILIAESHESTLPDNLKGKVAAYWPGKSETFEFIYGDALAILDADRVQILKKPAGLDMKKIPEALMKGIRPFLRRKQILARDFYYIAPGVQILVKKNARHTVLAGELGVIYKEYSTPSHDEANLFTRNWKVQTG